MEMQAIKNEILFIYNSKIFSDKQALGYIIPLKDHKIKELDLYHDQLTERQLKQIADKMKIETEDLLDKKSDDYKNQVKGKSLDDEDILTVLKENPDMLRTPIALTENKAVFVKDPYSLIQDDMEIEGVNRGYKSD